MSMMLQHLLMFYKLGGKQLYYFNTYDGQGEIDVDKMTASHEETNGVETNGVETNGYHIEEDEACESCTI